MRFVNGHLTHQWDTHGYGFAYGGVRAIILVWVNNVWIVDEPKRKAKKKSWK